MAAKKSYNRFFIIFQEEDKGYGMGVDKPPTGYAKIETKNEKGKVTVYVQNLKPFEEGEGLYKCYLISHHDNKDNLVYLGNINIDELGRGESSWESPVEDSFNSKVSIDKFNAAAIVVEKPGMEKVVAPLAGYMSKEKFDWRSKIIIERPKVEIVKEEEERLETVDEEAKKFEEYEKEIEKVMENREEVLNEKIEEAKEEAKPEDERKEEIVEAVENIEVVEEVEAPLEEDLRENKVEEIVEASREDTDLDDDRHKKKDHKDHECHENHEDDKKDECDEKHEHHKEDKCEEKYEHKKKDECEEKHEHHKEEKCEEKHEHHKEEECECHKDHEKHEHHEDHECHEKHEEKEYHDHHDECPCHEKYEESGESDDDSDSFDEYEHKYYQKGCMSGYYNYSGSYNPNYSYSTNYYNYNPNYNVNESYRRMMKKILEDILEDYEEMEKCKDIKDCRFWKIDMEKCKKHGHMVYMYPFYDLIFYPVIYNPMCNHYEYVKRHGHYLFGIKYGKKKEVKALVFCIPGGYNIYDQPFAGRTGFTKWISWGKEGRGYWIMMYDPTTGMIMRDED